MDKQQYYGKHAYNSQQFSQQRLASQIAPSHSLERPLGNKGEVPQELFFQLLRSVDWDKRFWLIKFYSNL